MIGEEFSLPEDTEFLWLILGLIWINRTSTMCWWDTKSPDQLFHEFQALVGLGSLGDEILASYTGMINDYITIIRISIN